MSSRSSFVNHLGGLLAMINLVAIFSKKSMAHLKSNEKIASKF